MGIKFSEAIKNNRDIRYGEGISPRELFIYNHKLAEGGYAQLREDFGDILKQFNGIIYDGAEIFAVKPKDVVFSDIVAKNAELEWNADVQALVIGEDESCYLLFDDDEDCFKIIDKEDETEWGCYEDAEKAAAAFLKI